MITLTTYKTPFADIKVTGDKEDLITPPIVSFGDDVFFATEDSGLVSFPSEVYLDIRRSLVQAALIEWAGQWSNINVPRLPDKIFVAGMIIRASESPTLSDDTTRAFIDEKGSASTAISSLLKVKEPSPNLVIQSLSKVLNLQTDLSSGIDGSSIALLKVGLIAVLMQNGLKEAINLLSDFNELAFVAYLSNVAEYKVALKFLYEAILDNTPEFWADNAVISKRTSLPCAGTIFCLNKMRVFFNNARITPGAFLVMWILFPLECEEAHFRLNYLNGRELKDLSEDESLWYQTVFPDTLDLNTERGLSILSLSSLVNSFRAGILLTRKYGDTLPQRACAIMAFHGSGKCRQLLDSSIDISAFNGSDFTLLSTDEYFEIHGIHHASYCLKSLLTGKWLELLERFVKEKNHAGVSVVLSTIPENLDFTSVIDKIDNSWLLVAPTEWGLFLDKAIAMLDEDHVLKARNLSMCISINCPSRYTLRSDVERDFLLGTVFKNNRRSIEESKKEIHES